MDVIDSKWAIGTAGEALPSVESQNLRSPLPGHFDGAGLVGNTQAFREFSRFYIQGLAVQVAAARLTSRGIFILDKRGCEVFIQDVGEVRFPTLGEDFGCAIRDEDTIDRDAKAALTEDRRDLDFQAVGMAAKASPVIYERDAVFIFQPPAEIGRHVYQF
jgi:hypothetical protein